MKLVMSENGIIDLATGSAGLLKEDSLETAVMISLLTDARAHADDELPAGIISEGPIPADRRGWVGDALDTSKPSTGSRLWLLKREKQTEETRRRAKQYCEEALQWLIDDGHAQSVSVAVEWSTEGRLEFFVSMALYDGSSYAQTLKLGDTNAI